MERRDHKVDEEEAGQLFVWKGYTGKVELISFKTFLTKPVRRVSLGGDHSLILTYDDCLFACGSNEHGQLGCPNLGQEYSFDPCLVDTVSGQNIQHIACGTNHSACIDGDGTLYIWGDNQQGQCASDPSEQDKIISPGIVELSAPDSVCQHGITSPGSKDAAYKISCGTTHSVALSAEGNVWVWGRGPQLGLGDNKYTWAPVILNILQGKKVIDIYSGEFHNALLIAESTEVNEQSTQVKTKTESRYSVLKSDVSDNVPVDIHSVCSKCTNQQGNLERFDQTYVHADEQGSGKTVSQSDIENTLDIVKDVTADVVDVNEVFVKLNSDKADEGDDLKKEVTGDVKKSLSYEETDVKTAVIKAESDSSKEANKIDRHVENSIYDVYSPESKIDGKLDIAMAVSESSKAPEVELRQKNIETKPTIVDDLLTASIRSDTSVVSSWSGKASRSKSFLNETGAREYLARQFQDDDGSEEPSSKPSSHQLEETVPLAPSTSQTPSSPGTYMMQTVSTLTSHVSSMTTKALSNIASVPGKFRFAASGTEEETRSSTEALDVSEISDLESSSTENMNLDKAILDFSNLTVSDTSLNASQLSLLDSEKSNESGESQPSSPAKMKKKESNRRSVSKESQSIRTIEAKQENLRKRSLSLLAADEKQREHVSTEVYTLNTEIWTWGRGNRGQLGLGDMLDRSEPYCIQTLNGRRIVKLACGSQHTMALSSTGEVYSWGLNDNGQLGHGELDCSPARIELTYDCDVWSVGAGSNHSVFLMDNAGTQGTRPEVYYTGKHPCKDLYVPIYKTARLTPLKYLKKAGWICSVTTGGDNCACVSRHECELTHVIFEVSRFVRELHRHLQMITRNFVKRIRLSGFFTSLEVQPYKTMLDCLLTTFTDLSTKIGVAGVEISDKLCRGESVLTASLFTSYDEYVQELKTYSTAYEDMVATGGFEYCTRHASSLFDTLQEFYKELLKTNQSEAKHGHAAKFRQIMFIPLKAVRDLSTIVNKFSELFNKSSRENNLLSSVHLNLEHFVRMSQSTISDADNTRMFWESSATKISDSLKSPTRRLIKESRSSPLMLTNAGRFSTNTFYLFNDLFIHAQYSAYQSYPLHTVWIDTPSSDSTSQLNLITVTTPEEVLYLSTPSSQIKVEWVIAFNTAINKVLASDRSVSRQNSGERVHTPVFRLATHTFTKHTLYREAKYRGYWLNGKVHGSGILKWPEGRKYRGKFKHGSITGSGRMYIPKENSTAEIQEGTWRDGKLHGPGLIKYSTGDLYDGYFKEAMRHGHGVYRKGKYLNSASFVYVGEWLFDKKHGYGVMDDILKGKAHIKFTLCDK